VWRRWAWVGLFGASMSVNVMAIGANIPHAELGEVARIVGVAKCCLTITECPHPSKDAKIVLVSDVSIDKICRLMRVDPINDLLVECDKLTFVRPVRVCGYFHREPRLPWDNRATDYWRLRTIIRINGEISWSERSIGERVIENNSGFTPVVYAENHSKLPSWLKLRFLISNFYCNKATFTFHKSPHLHACKYSKNEGEVGDRIESSDNASGSSYQTSP
jgi:hypothetical protein